MVAYEFYLVDDRDEFHLLGVLPERRKGPPRISPESIRKWGTLILGDLYFIQVEV